MGATYVDGPEAGTVAGSHVGVESLDSGGARELTVLLVHVVGARAGVVADPNTEVLDLQGVLLGDLMTGSLVSCPRISMPSGRCYIPCCR